MTRTSRRPREGARRDERRSARGCVADRRWRPGWRSPARAGRGPRHVREVVGHVDATDAPRGSERVERPDDDLVDGGRAVSSTSMAPACRRLMSRRFSTRAASRSSDSSAGLEQLAPVALASMSTSGLEQAGHGGLGRGERRPQVVADRGEQRRPHAVRLGDRRDLGRLLAQLLDARGRPRPGRRTLRGAGGRRRARGRPRRASTRSGAACTDVSASPGCRHASRRRSRPAASGLAPAVSVLDGAAPRRTGRTPRAPARAGPGTERLAAEHAAGQRREGGGLGARAGRLPGAPRREVDDRADRHRDHDEHQRWRVRCCAR